MEYYIICASDILNLEGRINHYAEEGWRLVNICIIPMAYFAAMERKKP